MKRWILAGAVNGFVAVAAGAFAAHALATRIDARALEIWQTGAHYHLVHALALVALGCLPEGVAGARANVAAWLFLSGILCFSGSLYFLGLTGSNALVLLTPVGGLGFLGGWAMLALAALTRR